MSSPTPKVLDQEYDYDDKEEGVFAEQSALQTNTNINPKALPTKTYLGNTVMPILTKALTELVKKKPRPSDPAEFVAYYLLTHHPKLTEKH